MALSFLEHVMDGARRIHRYSDPTVMELWKHLADYISGRIRSSLLASG
jgi:hypothetical protein